MDTFPSTIYTGSNPEFVDSYLKNLGHAKTNNPDLFLQQKTDSYALEEIKDLIKFFTTRPISHTTKIAVLVNAHLLTPICQNALLKTLEEPGVGNYLLLTTPKLQSLLPTICSRCHIEADSSLSPANPIPEKIATIPKDILLFSEEHGQNKESTLYFLESQLLINQQELVKNPSQNLATHIKKIIKSIHMIKHNVDPKSSLDWLLLTSTV